MIPQEKQQNLLGYIIKQVKNEDDAKDILQDSYLEYLQKKNSVEIKDAFSYLFSIVGFKIKVYHHKKPTVKNFQDYLKREMESAVSYNDGLYAYDIKCRELLENNDTRSFVETRITVGFSKTKNTDYNFFSRESSGKIYKPTNSRGPKPVIYNFDSKEIIFRSEVSDKLNNIFKLPNKAILKVKDFIDIGFIKQIIADTKINVIRIHSKGIVGISTNDQSFCKRYFNTYDKHKNCQWIFIKDSQIKMLK